MFFVNTPPRSRILLLAGLMMSLIGLWYGMGLVYPTAEEWKQRYQDAAQSRDWDTARNCAQRWSQTAPESGEARLRLAELLVKQRQYQAAMDCYGQVPVTSGEWETAMTAGIELQFGPLNRPAEGASDCEVLLRQNPNSLAAQQRLIFFLAMTLQRTRLIQQIRQAIEMGSEPRESYVYLFFADSLSFSNGAELNSQWLASDPDSELYEVAIAIFTTETLDASLSMDDLEAAETSRRAQAKKGAVMEALLAKYPHNTELLAYAIRQRMQGGKRDEAIFYLAKATVDAEQDHRFWRFKGWIHADRDEIGEAEKSYRRAIELHPLDWSTRHLLAELCQKQQKFDEVQRLRELVTRANELRRTLQSLPNARNVPQEVMIRLADYAADCGDHQVSAALRRRIRQYKRS